ncbi:hypothetical protein ACQ4PT_020261 [Festuca glaucescens]
MPPPSMLPQLGGVVVGVTAAARPPNLFSYSLLSIGLGSCPFSSGSSRCGRRFSSNAEQSTRSRKWWSNEAQFDDDDGEFEEDEEGSSSGGSASWGQAFDEPWFTKAFRAYGYVLPVILVYMLAATGPKAFLVAMAIPLAQSAVSLASRAFSNTSFNWGSRNQEEYDGDYYSDYRSSGWEESEQEEEEEYSNTFSSSTNYKDSSSSRSQQQQPWAKGGESEDAEATADSDDTGSASSSNDTSNSGSSAGFGGWDELDAGNDYRNSSSRRSAGTSAAADTATGGGGGAARSMRRRRPQPETRRPRSRAAAAARYRQSPLFMRLLVALFPFLGSWFRIML